MRAYDLLSSFRVAVNAGDIERFNRRWPCSELRGLRGVSFTFDKRGGSLEDVHYANGTPERWDGAALVALSQDAHAYGAKRFGVSP